jgi:beta-lactamase regulating signal transducer with metallopeptidase domain
MNAIGSFLRFDGPIFERLAAALAHFVWQGALVALAYAAADRLLRRRGAASNTRYALACGALAALLLLPIATFARSRSHVRSEIDSRSGITASAAAAPAAGRAASNAAFLPAVPAGVAGAAVSGTWRGWLLGIWLAGVAALSMRFLAGCAGVARLARRVSEETDSAVSEAFARLRQRLGVSAGVRLLRSAAVEVPAALGILKPIVLLPVSALTGLDARQVEALLAHELAHVKRHDYGVNLLQSVVETVLFYHPAVWWVSGRIRAERENACDDLAVAAMGDARLYAGALVGLEELRAGSRRLAVAANGGQLRGRVLRLFPSASSSLSATADARSRRTAGGLALCALILVGAAAWIGPADGNVDPVQSERWARLEPPPVPPRLPVPAAAPVAAAAVIEPARPVEPPPAAPPAKAAPRVAVSQPVVPAVPVSAPPAVPAVPAPEPLSDDDMSFLRSRGVTPRFVQGLAELGYSRASVSDLVALRIHGVSTEDVGEYQKIFGRISLERCVALKIHGASPGWIRETAASFGGKLSPDQATALRIHGVNADFLARFREAGYPPLSVDEALAARIHGVDPSQASALAADGARPSLDDLLSARIHGVDANFAREIRAELPGTGLDELVALRIHGVTASFLSEMKKLGFAKLSGDEAVALRIHGVTPEYVREMKAAGVKDLGADAATELRIHGVSTDFARALKAEGYSSLSTDDLTSLRIHGWTLEDVRKANRAAGRRVPLDELLDGDINRRLSR